MERRVKYWILSCLSQCEGDKGEDVKKMFEQKPDFVTDDLTRFFKLLLELESSGLIQFVKETEDPHFKITKEGKATLHGYMKKANIKDVFKCA
jgi:DNA-binding PadR family transcriptional regulator